MRRLMTLLAVLLAVTIGADAQSRMRFVTAATVAGSGITFDSGFNGTGTFSDGQVVTITRAAGSWGSKPNGSKALYYWPLEANLNPDATYSRNTTNPNSWSTDTSFTTAILAPNAAGSARMDLTCAGGNCAMGPNDGVPFTGSQTYVYVRRYFPSALDPTSFNIKFPRFWPVTISDNNFYEGFDGASGVDGAPRYSTENCPGGGESVSGGHGFRQSQWTVDEYEAQQSSAVDVRDGEFHHIRNATYAFPRSTQRWITKCAAAGLSTAQTVVFGEQHSNNVTASPWYTYWDLYVVDDSWCRLMISSESTWNITGAVSTSNPGTERVREWQPVSSWSTTSITFLVQRRTLTLSGMYLWVIGGSGCTTAERIGQFT
jgi:hypothetical protein